MLLLRRRVAYKELPRNCSYSRLQAKCINLPLLSPAVQPTTPGLLQPPNLTLTGPTTMTITQGRPYDFCTPSSTLADLCDRGATAADATDGVLNNVIRFCGFPLYQDKAAAIPVAIPPITVACGINTQLPGSYPVNFSVANSARVVVTVVRTLVVQAACRSGEYVCTDLVGVMVYGIILMGWDGC